MNLPASNSLDATFRSQSNAIERAMGRSVWGRRAARLPEEGVLILSTDLQGNLGDYEALKRVYFREQALGHNALLAFCGDMVHGPSPDLNEPGAWPAHLGTAYVDESAELIRDFEAFTRTERSFSVLGNHEHAHIGGPVVPKFHPDEAAVLDEALGNDRERIHTFFRSWPLVAVAPCGVVLTHGAPRRTEPTLQDFENLRYDGHRRDSIQAMYMQGTLGALLWARSATPVQARALLAATSLDGKPGAFVAYGHDVVPSGYEKVGDEQICFSTSFGLYDPHKVYLRLDLSRRYRSVHDLREGIEIIPLYG